LKYRTYATSNNNSIYFFTGDIKKQPAFYTTKPAFYTTKPAFYTTKLVLTSKNTFVYAGFEGRKNIKIFKIKKTSKKDFLNF